MKLILGDSLQKLKDLPTNTVDAIVTDPPYGWRFMGKAWDGADIEKTMRDKQNGPREGKALAAGMYAQDFTSNQYFMHWTYDWAQEAIRVLKPGGHMLVFCGPRTYHAMAMGVEMAGFEIRDQLQWLFGSGFPKSLDVSKAIDKAAGAERTEVVGTKLGRPGMAKDGSNQSFDSSTNTYGSGGILSSDITAPATDDAKRWQGYGTALKPANEPIVLARKPLEKGFTVAENVLKWGTGALAIDATRIAASDQAALAKNWDREKLTDMRGGSYGNGQASGIANTHSAPQGRWPANCLFDEEAARLLDEQSGVSKSPRETKHTPDIARKQSNAYGDYSQSGRTIQGHGDSGGASRFFKVIKQNKFDILGECLVKNADGRQSNVSEGSVQSLAQQSSQHASADKNQNKNTCAPNAQNDSRTIQEIEPSESTSFAQNHATPSIDSENLSGSASDVETRLKSITTDFAQSIAAIHPDLARSLHGLGFTDCSKDFIQNLSHVLTAENQANTVTTETIQSFSKLFGSVARAIASNTQDLVSGTVSDCGQSASRFLYQAKASKRERNAGLEGMPERESTERNSFKGLPDLRMEHEQARNPSANHHPTVKPIKLMEYLVRMVTPPGGIVLDPFMGSGTTGCAAVKLGRQFIGIEREQEYIEIARCRIEHWRAESEEPTPDDDQLSFPEAGA